MFRSVQDCLEVSRGVQWLQELARCLEKSRGVMKCSGLSRSV